MSVDQEAGVGEVASLLREMGQTIERTTKEMETPPQEPFKILYLLTENLAARVGRLELLREQDSLNGTDAGEQKTETSTTPTCESIESGKRYPLNLRTTHDVREKLEGFAKANNRSLVQSAEVLLLAGFEALERKKNG